jgi:hypothetical protein
MGHWLIAVLIRKKRWERHVFLDELSVLFYRTQEGDASARKTSKK